MGERTAKGVLLAACIWIVVVGILAVAAKMYILPYFRDELAEETGSESLYSQEVTIAADSFSGYCIIRSPVFRNGLKDQGVKATILDDGAAYEKRMKSLEDRDVQMAVFTIDSFVKTGAMRGSFPATVVLVIDETSGADAIVAYKASVPRLEDLNDPKARIVLTPDSPSEFLARTVIAHFSLPNLPEMWWQEADGAEDVYAEFLRAGGDGPRAYVLWEPYVSLALERKDAHLLLDSSKLKGYIVDVLVAERRFLRDHPDLVRAVVEVYLRAAYSYSQSPERMRKLVYDDAKEPGTDALNDAQVEKLVDGIEWKNTLENYGYFGLLAQGEAKGTQHLEEVFSNISNVLVKTGAIPEDPIRGKAHTLFYDETLRALQAEGFHPGKKINLIQDMGLGTQELAPLRTGPALKALTEKEWAELAPVARMRVKALSFARGTARIHVQSRRELSAIAQKMAAWPEYYLLIVGHARAQGDPQANLALARKRAEVSADQLIQMGIDRNRIRTEAAPPLGRTGEAQSVSFEMRQNAY